MPEIDINLLKNKLPGFAEAFSSDVLEVSDYKGDLSVVVSPSRIRDVVAFLKNQSVIRFEILMDLFAVDYMMLSTPTPERFAVIYSFYSLTNKRRVRIKIYVSEEKPEVDSVHDIYKMVNWFEREAWDLYGIVFKGHPNLTRILCHGEFVGHPLRKDYPSDQYQQLKRAIDSSRM